MADFDYGNARLHAMKAQLLTRWQIEEMAGVGSIPGMISALMKTAYHPAIEYSIARTTGIETVFQALRFELLRTVQKIRSFYQHEAGEMVIWILRSYDIHNLKAILRGLSKHIAPVEILVALLPVGDLAESALVELSRAATPRVAVDIMASMNLSFARPLLKLRAEHPGADSIDMELALEKWYYKEVGSFIDEMPQSSDVFRESIAIGADFTNLLTVLRFVHTPAERKILFDQVTVRYPAKTPTPDRRPGVDIWQRLLVLPGKLSYAVLEHLSRQDNMDEVLKLLANTAYAPALEAGMRAYRQSGRLSDVEKHLRMFRLKWMAHQIPKDPLGIGVFLGYHALKMNEIGNLRWIAHGIQAAYKPEAIRAGLEFVQ